MLSDFYRVGNCFMVIEVKRKYVYKELTPADTIKRIRQILASLNINTSISDRVNNLNQLYSCRLSLVGLPYGTNGKSYTREFSDASAYGELMERIQNQLLYKLVEFSPKVRESYGFRQDPRETVVSGSNIPLLPKDFLRARIEDGGGDLYSLWKQHRVDLRKRNLTVTMIPFYNVKDEKVSYLPAEFVSDFFGSNGMCAGNTPEEALDQGLSEICERYVQRELYLNEITPPTIPEDYLKRNAPIQFAIIENLRRQGNYRIIVKDCGLGREFPVVGVIFLRPESGHYWFNLGSSPIWQIALERCLTEAFQGFPVGQTWKFSQVKLIPPFHCKSNPLLNYVNYVNLVCTEVGHYPPALLGTVPSYSFKGYSGADFKTQKDKMNYLIKFIRGTGHNLYIRDASILGWPAFHVVSPGLSELLQFSPSNWRGDILTSFSRVGAMRRIDDLTVTKLGELVDDMKCYLLSSLPIHSRKEKVPFITLADYLNIPGHEKTLWRKTSLQLMCALLAGYIAEWAIAFSQADKYVSDMELVFSDKPEYRKHWLRAVIARDWFGFRARGLSSKEAKDSLLFVYKSEDIEKVLSLLQKSKNPSSLLQGWFRGLELPHCWDCMHCSMRKDCSYKKLEPIHLRVKAAAALRRIDQFSVRSIVSA